MALDLDDRRCKMCGKVFTVLYPDRWAYKKSINGKRYDYYCSWKCLRSDELQKQKPKRKERPGREAYNLANVRRRDPREVITQLMDAMAEGQDPRDFLKSLGYINASDQLKKLKIWAEKNDKKAAAELAKIKPLKKGRAPAAKKEPRVIGRVVKKQVKNGGLRVEVKTSVPADDLLKAINMPAEPKPMDGGEWVNIRAMTAEELAEDNRTVSDPGPVIKDFPLPVPPPMLKVAGLESEAIDKATWVRTGEMITLNSGSDMSMILKPEQWRKLSTEIELMLEQFGA